MKRIKLIIKGRVQGIFYRKITQKTAISLGIIGYVRNLPDGSVEVVAEAPEQKLKELIGFCRKGPERAVVTNIQIQFSEPKNEFTTFSIRY